MARAQWPDTWADLELFDEAGLAPNQTITYRLTGSATANYACNATNGQLDQIKQQLAAGSVRSEGYFTADAAGKVRGRLTLSAPPAPSTTCPIGYALGIWRISYEKVRLEDLTNRVSEPMAGLTAVGN